MEFVVDINQAAKETGEYITSSGVYEIDNFTAKLVKKDNSMAEMIEFSFNTVDGQAANYVSLCIAKKDGTRAFGFNKFLSILCVSGFVNAQMGFGNDNILKFPKAIIPFKIGLQREAYYKRDGSEGYRFNITHAFYKKTGQTVSEQREGKQAAEILKPIKDKAAPKQNNQQPLHQQPPAQDLPPVNSYDQQNNGLPSVNDQRTGGNEDLIDYLPF